MKPSILRSERGAVLVGVAFAAFILIAALFSTVNQTAISYVDQQARLREQLASFLILKDVATMLRRSYDVGTIRQGMGANCPDSGIPPKNIHGHFFCIGRSEASCIQHPFESPDSPGLPKLCFDLNGVSGNKTEIVIALFESPEKNRSTWTARLHEWKRKLTWYVAGALSTIEIGIPTANAIPPKSWYPDLAASVQPVYNAPTVPGDITNPNELPSDPAAPPTQFYAHTCGPPPALPDVRTNACITVEICPRIGIGTDGCKPEQFTRQTIAFD